MRFRAGAKEGEAEGPGVRGGRAAGQKLGRVVSVVPREAEAPSLRGQLQTWLEGRGLGRAGVCLAVRPTFTGETGDTGGPGGPCACLVLCPQNFLFSSSSQLERPPETLDSMK